MTVISNTTVFSKYKGLLDVSFVSSDNDYKLLHFEIKPNNLFNDIESIVELNSLYALSSNGLYLENLGHLRIECEYILKGDLALRYIKQGANAYKMLPLLLLNEISVI